MKQTKTWTGYRERPATRAKTWGAKTRDPRKERREARRDLKGSRFALIVPIKFCAAARVNFIGTINLA
jgi:hypothetical protein